MEPLSRTPRRPFLTCAAPGCQHPEGRGSGHLLLCLLSSSCPGSASSALLSPRSRPLFHLALVELPSLCPQGPALSTSETEPGGYGGQRRPLRGKNYRPTFSLKKTSFIFIIITF